MWAMQEYHYEGVLKRYLMWVEEDYAEKAMERSYMKGSVLLIK